MEYLKQYFTHDSKTPPLSEKKEDSTFLDNTSRRVFPAPANGGSLTKYWSDRSRGSNPLNRNIPSINMSCFDFITHEEDKETSKDVCYAALTALSKTGSVIRASVYETEYEWRIVICMAGNPVLGMDQIDFIRNSAVGRIRNVLYSVHVPQFTQMQTKHNNLHRGESWEYENREEQPHALGVETSVSIYLMRRDTVPAEKLRGEDASSETRVKKRGRSGSR